MIKFSVSGITTIYCDRREPSSWGAGAGGTGGLCESVRRWRVTGVEKEQWQGPGKSEEGMSAAPVSQFTTDGLPKWRRSTSKKVYAVTTLHI